MKKNKIDIQDLRIKISTGLDLTFAKLIKEKKAKNGVIILSEKGIIKKIKAADINN